MPRHEGSNAIELNPIGIKFLKNMSYISRQNVSKIFSSQNRLIHHSAQISDRVRNDL